MGAIAKRFLGRRAATAKRHSFFNRELIPVAVVQFYFALHDVRTVLNCFDCHHVRTLTDLSRLCHVGGRDALRAAGSGYKTVNDWVDHWCESKKHQIPTSKLQRIFNHPNSRETR